MVREPTWTVFSIVVDAKTPWVGSSWEFFDDEEAAESRCDELRALGCCPTKRFYFRDSDRQYVRGFIQK